MGHLEKNLDKSKANHPWPYFLSQRAMKSIEAVQVVKTAVEEKKDRIAALKSAGKIVGGLVGVAGATAITVTTFGAGTPILAVAIIGFGATVVDAFKSSKEIIEGIRSAHKSLSNQHATSLNWFQNMNFSNNEAPKKPLLNWEEEVAPAINGVIEKLNSGELKSSSDVEKMAMIYFMTTLLVNSHAPKEGLKKVRDMLIQFYNASRKEPHVQLFILESFCQLYTTTIHHETIPKVTAAKYESILLGEKPTNDKEVNKNYKKLATLLKEQIQTVHQDKSQQYLMVKPTEHRLMQEAWFQWYQNDRALYIINDQLANLVAQHPTTDLEKQEHKATLIKLRTQFDDHRISLSLDNEALTSKWGRECYEKIEQVFSQMKISSTAIVSPIFARQSIWKIRGKIIRGNYNQYTAVAAEEQTLKNFGFTKEDFKELILKGVRTDFFKELNVTTEEEKKEADEFMQMLAKCVDLDLAENGKIIAGNENLAEGLRILCSELEFTEKPIRSDTPFWHQPPQEIKFNEQSKKVFLELKKTCQFEVGLIVGNGKPMVRITIKPSEQSNQVVTESLISILKSNLLSDLAKNNIKVLPDEKVNSEGLILELTGYAKTLRVVHAWLCQVAAIPFQPEFEEKDSARYRCNVM